MSRKSEFRKERREHPTLSRATIVRIVADHSVGRDKIKRKNKKKNGKRKVKYPFKNTGAYFSKLGRV